MDEERENDFYDVQKSKESLEKVKRSMPSPFLQKPYVDPKSESKVPKVVQEILDQGKEPPYLMAHYYGSLEQKAHKAL